MSKRERRFLQSDVTVEHGESPKITGYAAVFNSRSFLLGDFVEEVDPGAFTECLASNPDIVGLFNHSNDMVLGRTTSGTMRVSVDATGLKYEIDPPETSYAKDLIVSMRRGDIKSSSFGFVCQKDSWSYDKKTNQNVRRIIKAEIFDCSPVTNPAYGESSSQVRSLFPDDKGSVPEEITAKLAELRTSRRAEKRGRNILAAMSSNFWAIEPSKLETICAFLTGWSEGHVVSKEEIQAVMMGQETSAFDAEASNGVAILPIYGTIGKKMTMMTEISGGFSCEQFTKDFRSALDDDSVKAIVFDIDSPGGTVTGVPELAAEILAARGQKPIIAVSNGFTASAATWLATAADEVVVIPSGSIGSIGVYCTHEDVSAAMEKAGVKIQFIKAGEFKTEGNPYEPASEGYLAYRQKQVDAIYDDFTGFVATGRGVTVDKVNADFGQGRMLSAKDAVAAGLADRIATLDQVVAGLVASAVVPVIEAITETTDSGIEAETTEPAAMQPSGCACNCVQCMGGAHDDCIGEDGICDWEDGSGDGDDYTMVAQGVPFADLTPEESAAQTITGLPTMKYFKVLGGVTEVVTKEQFDAFLESASKAAPVVADRTNEEIAASYLAKVAETEANANSMRRLKLLQLQSY